MPERIIRIYFINSAFLSLINVKILTKKDFKDIKTRSIK